MKITKKGRAWLVYSRKAFTVSFVGMFLFLLSMLFVNNLSAEVFKATAYCS